MQRRIHRFLSALVFLQPPNCAMMTGIQLERLGIDYIDQRNSFINSVTLDDVNRVAKKSWMRNRSPWWLLVNRMACRRRVNNFKMSPGYWSHRMMRVVGDPVHLVSCSNETRRRAPVEKSNLRLPLAQCTAKTSNIVCLVQPAGSACPRRDFWNYRAVLPPVWRRSNGGSRAEVQAILDDVTSSTGLEGLEPLAERYAEFLMM